MVKAKNAKEHHGGHGPKVELVEVVVMTTSGAFPGHGHRREKVTDIVGEILRQAAHALKLTDTSNWVATVDGREIDPSKSYAENNLVGTVTINWGPREGGGGC